MKGFQGESFSGENMDISQLWERPMVYLNGIGEIGGFSAWTMQESPLEK